jgi:hypothetical protein
MGTSTGGAFGRRPNRLGHGLHLLGNVRGRICIFSHDHRTRRCEHRDGAGGNTQWRAFEQRAVPGPPVKVGRAAALSVEIGSPLGLANGAHSGALPPGIQGGGNGV